MTSASNSSGLPDNVNKPQAPEALRATGTDGGLSGCLGATGFTTEDAAGGSEDSVKGLEHLELHRVDAATLSARDRRSDPWSGRKA